VTSFRISNKELVIEKEQTELDTFVLDLVKVIKKYCKYTIISGFVSIFFGRARATEDVDAFISDVSYETFRRLYAELKAAGYDFTIDNQQELYNNYLKDGIPVNIWKKDLPLIRLEIKLALKKTQKLVMQDSFTARFNGNELVFGSIESQIAYKRYIAKSQKDLEDARHLEIVFEGLDKEKINFYKTEFLQEFNNG